MDYTKQDDCMCNNSDLWKVCQYAGEDTFSTLVNTWGSGTLKLYSLNLHSLNKHKGELTHWGREKMAAISQTTLSSAFSWMKLSEFRSKFHWSFFPKSPTDNILALFQIMAWRRPGDKPLSEAMKVSLLTHICVARPQCVSSEFIHHTNFWCSCPNGNCFP